MAWFVTDARRHPGQAASRVCNGPAGGGRGGLGTVVAAVGRPAGRYRVLGSGPLDHRGRSTWQATASLVMLAATVTTVTGLAALIRAELLRPPRAGEPQRRPRDLSQTSPARTRAGRRHMCRAWSRVGWQSMTVSRPTICT
ncbi:hypothetical protein GTY91_27520, partial [Streptomyces sp. SID69]|nr:hypothetical protein [Streptomyces sp. SID69]